MTADPRDAAGPASRHWPEPPESPKPAWWRKALWGIVAGPAWLVNKMLGNVR